MNKSNENVTLNSNSITEFNFLIKKLNDELSILDNFKNIERVKKHIKEKLSYNSPSKIYVK